MCGIAGFCDFSRDYTRQRALWDEVAQRMKDALYHRGPDSSGVYASKNLYFAHTRLAVIDPARGQQPMERTVGGNRYVIAYNGELYNADELRKDLLSRGYILSTRSDTEVLLYTYIQYGEDCARRLNGIFAFAVWDEARRQCFFCRDPFGVKPLFYCRCGETLVFASEIKALFEYPEIEPRVGREGLCEVLAIGPARTPGKGIFEGVEELKPGCSALFSQAGFKTYPYFKLESREHPDDYETTVKTVRELLFDSIDRQLTADVPLCSLLSGGLDSSVIAAVASLSRERGCPLDTYSFDYTGNDSFFRPTAFQPDADQPWAQRVSALLGTNHQTLACSNQDLADGLWDAVKARDLPGMADIDSSLLYFCRLVRKEHTVALSGECADEIFGGYPWFHDPAAFSASTFPWSRDLSVRKALLAPEVLDALDLEEYAAYTYAEALEEVPALYGESAEESRRRQISYLNIRWFMTLLLERKDRMSMASGLEVRVPFADPRLVQYLFNVPWAMKAHDGIPKALLRDAAAGLLPEEILARRKSPYPKTHNPGYESLVKARLKRVLEDEDQPLNRLIDRRSAKALLHGRSDPGQPWFGQLMAGPQLIAYLLEINDWMLEYGLSFYF